MRPYSQGINRGNAAGGLGAGGLGTGATTQQQREAQRLERERNEREERERLERAGLAQLSDLSEEQREEINEAVSQTWTPQLVQQVQDFNGYPVWLVRHGQRRIS
jgi:hypothetical protein